jgi:proline racemase
MTSANKIGKLDHQPQDEKEEIVHDGITTTTNHLSSIDFQLPQRLFCNPNNVVLKCIDCHAGGEPARVVFSGIQHLVPASCATALQKRNYMMEHLDHIRQRLLLEPRGYPCQNVNYIFATTATSIPSSSDIDTNVNDHQRPQKRTNKKLLVQYVIGEQSKIYPLMSGHNTMCVATALLETGVIPMQEPLTQFTLEAPAGNIEITAKCSNDGKATSIAFQNAPSFVERLNVIVNVPNGIGSVVCDIAYGGMWYAVVDLGQFTNNPQLQHLNMTLDRDNGAELCRVGEMIKVACREQYPVQHPDPTIDYPGVDILVFRERPVRRKGDNVLHGRNTVPMSNTVLDWNKPETMTAMLDRSPCGTGTCAVMTVMHARGELKVGEQFVHESIVGSTFTGTILKEITLETTEKTRSAILPQVEGSSCITQYSEVVVDPHDPFPEGYKVGDIW